MPRIYFTALVKHDREHKTSHVRELEMAAEAALTSPGYSQQFWRDIVTYGVDEAILYVRNGKHGNADAIAAAWKRIKVKMGLV